MVLSSRRQDLAYRAPIVEGMEDALHLLRRFMSLAGDTDQVARAGLTQSLLDREPTIRNPDRETACGDTFGHIREDPFDRFGSWIVGGKQNPIGQLAGCRSHLRPLRPVPVAPAADNDPEPVLTEAVMAESAPTPGAAVSEPAPIEIVALRAARAPLALAEPAPVLTETASADSAPTPGRVATEPTDAPPAVTAAR